MPGPDVNQAVQDLARPPVADRDRVGLVAGWVLFALAYLVFAQLGRLLAIPPEGWPALAPQAGLALAVVWRFGARLLPGVLAGGVASGLLGGLSPLLAGLAATGELATIALAVLLLQRRNGGGERLHSCRDVTAFLVIAACAAPLLGVGLTALGLVAAGTLPPWAALGWWTTHWLATAAGVVLVGAALTAWLQPAAAGTAVRGVFAAILGGCAAAAIAVFGGWLPAPFSDHPAMLLLPGLLLAAARLPQRQLTVVTALTALIAVLGTQRGVGPFVQAAPQFSLWLLQVFLLLVGGVTLMMRAVLAEREAANRALAGHRLQLEQRVEHAIEALRATNQQLEAERSFMAVVQDTMRNLLLVMDRAGRIVVFNRACRELSGYREEEALGRRPWALFAAPGEAAARAAAFAGLDAQQFPRAYEEDWWVRSGERRRIEWVDTAILDDAGGLLYVVATGLDVTARRAAEADVLRLNEHVRLLMESAMEGVLGVDTEGRCTFVNNAAASMLGYAADDLPGRVIHPLLQPRHEDGSPYPEGDSLIRRALREQRGFGVLDEVLWTRTGEALPVHYSVNPILEQGVMRGAVMVFRNMTEARALADHLDYLASHDELTGLHNRRYFDRHLAQALELARADGDRHVLCYLDLDQFKLVNDTCGHVAGDELLRQLGRELRSRVRRGDVLARLGGDEFGVLLHSCGLDQATALIEKLRRAICDYRFSWEGRGFALGVSIGVVQVTAATPSITEALSAADSACYVAKDAGRNRVHVYQERDVDLTRRHGEMQWVSRLHAAMAEDRLFLVAQRIAPTTAAADALHLEILMRLRDEEGREVSPASFIPAAERYNLMPAIDRWVIRQAFAWLAGIGDPSRAPGLCAINLSGGSVGDPGMRDYIVEQMELHGIAARRICFEITETAAVANLSSAAGFVRDLRALGFRFALDDFGCGMSSFAYLKNLPVDYLKIDGNFVKDILDDPGDDAMVRAINQVGHVMGLATVAEFVESPEILERLRIIGVDYAQGFGIARPEALPALQGAPA